jgi:hypothetical protein
MRNALKQGRVRKSITFMESSLPSPSQPSDKSKDYIESKRENKIVGNIVREGTRTYCQEKSENLQP